MGKTAAAASLLAVTLKFGILYSSKAAYAHNFGGDQSAAYLAKVKEVPVETHAILDDAFADLNVAIAQNASDYTIGSNFATTYRTQPVPEFPLAMGLGVAAIAGVIVFSRFRRQGKDKLSQER